jgi:hypothetical protein
MTALEDQARLLFLAAVERKPEEWRALLDQACGDHAEEEPDELAGTRPVWRTGKGR